jgi:hypothetical protein
MKIKFIKEIVLIELMMEQVVELIDNKMNKKEKEDMEEDMEEIMKENIHNGKNKHQILKILIFLRIVQPLL